MPIWRQSYIKNVQSVIHEHRDETADRFENRVDYVDLTAFGIGVRKQNSNVKCINQRLIHEQYDKIIEENSSHGRLNNRLR